MLKHSVLKQQSPLAPHKRVPNLRGTRHLFVAPVFLFALGTAWAQSASLSLSSGSTVAGGTTTLNLSLTTGGTQSAGIQWVLQYSPADVANITISTGSGAATGGKSVTCNSTVGSLMCLAYGVNQSSMGDGVIAQVTITSAPGIQSTAIPIQVINVIAADVNGNSVPITSAGAVITINQPPVLSSLVCSPSILNPGGSTACTVSLNKSSIATVALSSTASSLQVPASFAINGLTGTFTASATQFTSDTNTTITASLNGSSITSTVNLATLPQVSSLTCTPDTLNPGGSTTCTVVLSKSGTVTLSSTNASLTVPAQVSTSGTTAIFTATAGQFNADATARVTASLNGGSATVSINLATLPQVSSLSCSPMIVNPNGTTTCTVTLSKTVNSTITLSSSSTSLAVPVQVSIVGNSAKFVATAGPFTADESAMITVLFNGVSVTTPINLVSTLQVSSLICSPVVFSPYSMASCTVTLTKPGPVTVQLSSSHPVVAIPLSIQVLGTSATFTATIGNLNSDNTAAIAAAVSAP